MIFVCDIICYSYTHMWYAIRLRRLVKMFARERETIKNDRETVAITRQKNFNIYHSFVIFTQIILASSCAQIKKSREWKLRLSIRIVRGRGKLAWYTPTTNNNNFNNRHCRVLSLLYSFGMQMQFIREEN